MALAAAERDLGQATGGQHDTPAAPATPAVSLEDYFAQLSANAPEGWRVELIEGGIHAVPPANGEHEEILAELNDQVTLRRHDRSLRIYTGVGLRLPEAFPADQVVPDMVIAPRGSFATSQQWHEPGPVLLVVEVTSMSTADNDRGRKMRAYARTGIPHYLLIDRKPSTVTLHSEPSDGGFRRQLAVPMGERLMLPPPLDFELDTGQL